MKHQRNKRWLAASLAVVCALFSVPAVAGSAGQYPANINSLPGSGLAANHLVLGDTIQGIKDGGAVLPSTLCPALTGDVTAPSGTCATTLAKVAGVSASRALAVDGSNNVTGSFASSVLANSLTDETGSGSAVFSASPALTGSPTAPTQTLGDNTTKLATDAFVQAAVAAIPCNTLTGDVTSVGCATTVAKIQSTTVSGTTGSGNVVFSASPSLSGTTLAANLTASGIIKSTNAGGGGFRLDAAAGNVRSLTAYSGGLLRWQFLFADSGAESGSNAGSDLRISNYDDTGAAIGTPFILKRSTGLLTLANGATINSGLTLGTALTVPNGGIGVGTLASNGVLYGNGTGAVQALAVNSTATKKYLQQVSSGALSWQQIAAADISGLATIATSGSASDLATGTVPAARLPNPTASSLGGIESYAAVTHQWLDSISTSGVPHSSQPSAADLTGLAAIATSGSASDLVAGTVPYARMPAPGVGAGNYGGVIQTNCPGHYFGNLINSSGGLGCAQPDFTDLTGTLAPAQCPAATGLLLGCMFAPGNPPVSHQFFNSYNGTVWGSAQVDFSDLSGSLASAQFGPLTGDVTTSGYAATVAKIQGVTVAGTTGSGNVVFSANPVFTVAIQTPSLTVTGGGTIFAGSATITGPFRNTYTGVPQWSVDTTTVVDRQFALRTNGSTRWVFGADATAETGSNAGSNGYIARYDDTGTLLDKPLTIVRSTGAITIADGLTVTGALGSCTNQFYRSVTTAFARTCASVSLTADVTGILPGANGGTANGFMAFSGPATSLKTFTLPNASANILTDNALVTVAQGGLGVGTLASNGVLYGNGTGAVQALAVNSGAKLFLTDASSGAPGWNAITNSDLPLAFTSTKGAIIPALCPANYFSKGIDPGTATPTCAQVAASDVTGLATIATSGSASDLGTGTIPNARIAALPNANLANSSVTISGHSLSLGGSLSLAFSDLTGTPTTLLGYGITDGLKTTNNLSDVSSPVTATNNLGHWHKTLSAQVDKTANNSSAGVTDLTITGVAGKTYKYDIVLAMTLDATNGLRVRMGGVSTATSNGYTVTILCHATKVFDVTLRVTVWSSTNATETTCTSVLVEIKGTVIVNAGGTVTPQWAQMNTTNGSGVSSILVDGTYADYDQIN